MYQKIFKQLEKLFKRAEKKDDMSLALKIKTLQLKVIQYLKSDMPFNLESLSNRELESFIHTLKKA